MANSLAAALISVIVAAALSTLLYLPVLAVAESLSPRRARLRGGVWLAGLFVPLLVGVSSALLGLNWALIDAYGSPHLTALRPHLCARWMTAVPDGRTWIGLAGGCCMGMYAAAALRLTLTVWRTNLLCRRLREAAHGSNLVIAPDRGIFLATVGLRRPVTVLTTGTRELLSEDELSAALEHENAHGRRGDNAVDALASFALTCQFIIPTAHLFLRYWREDVERACDDEAAAIAGADTVAAALRRLAQSARRMPAGLSPRPEWDRTGDVERRAQRVIALQALHQEPVGRQTQVVGALLVAAAVVSVVLGIIATAGQARDSLYCLSESVLRALK